MILRILASILLLLSVLFLPLWVSVILALAGMIYFTIFWEAVALFLLSDLLFGVREEKFYGIVFITFILGIVLLLITEFVKSKTRFYK